MKSLSILLIATVFFLSCEAVPENPPQKSPEKLPEKPPEKKKHHQATRATAVAFYKKMDRLCEDVKNHRSVESERTVFTQNSETKRYTYRRHIKHPLKDWINAAKKEVKYDTWPGKGGEMKQYFEFDFKKSEVVKDYSVKSVYETGFEATSRRLFTLKLGDKQIYVRLWTSSMSSDDAQESIVRDKLFRRVFSDLDIPSKVKVGDVSFVDRAFRPYSIVFSRNNVTCMIKNHFGIWGSHRKENVEWPNMLKLAKEIDAAIIASPKLKKGKKVRNKYFKGKPFEDVEDHPWGYPSKIDFKLEKFPMLAKYKMIEYTEVPFRHSDHSYFSPKVERYAFELPGNTGKLKITFATYPTRELMRALATFPPMMKFRDKYYPFKPARKMGYNIGEYCLLERGRNDSEHKIIFYRGKVQCHLTAPHSLDLFDLKWLAYRLDTLLMGRIQYIYKPESLAK